MIVVSVSLKTVLTLILNIFIWSRILNTLSAKKIYFILEGLIKSDRWARKYA